MKLQLKRALNLLAKHLELETSTHKQILAQINALEDKPAPIESSLSLPIGCDAMIFSDGACRGNPGIGAYGLIYFDGTASIELSEAYQYTTNNQMEMYGVYKGMELAIKGLKAKIHIVTDSKYVIDGLKSWMPNWKKKGWKKANGKAPENLELWQALDKAVNQFESITYEWVKGHSGHLQNERCDQLANEALDEGDFSSFNFSS